MPSTQFRYLLAFPLNSPFLPIKFLHTNTVHHSPKAKLVASVFIVPSSNTGYKQHRCRRRHRWRLQNKQEIARVKLSSFTFSLHPKNIKKQPTPPSLSSNLKFLSSYRACSSSMLGAVCRW
uniref:Uncharacterized protein n=1 Tax=Salix viminalis TaxID=40686 RepID=A0A6N2MCC4_SALVM